MDTVFRCGDVYFNGSHFESTVYVKDTYQILGQIINYGIHLSFVKQWIFDLAKSLCCALLTSPICNAYY